MTAFTIDSSNCADFASQENKQTGQTHYLMVPLARNSLLLLRWKLSSSGGGFDDVISRSAQNHNISFEFSCKSFGFWGLTYSLSMYWFDFEPNAIRILQQQRLFVTQRVRWPRVVVLGPGQ